MLKFQEEVAVRVMEGLKSGVNVWMKDHNIKGFYSLTSDSDFGKGAASIMDLTGIGESSIFI